MANAVYVEYPCVRYHKILAPEGREILNAVKDAALGEGWVDTPAAFDPAYVPPATRLKDGDPMPVTRTPGQAYVEYPAMRYARDGREQEVMSDGLDPAEWKDHPWTAEEQAAGPTPVAAGTAEDAPPVVSPVAASLYLLNAAESTLLVNGQDTPEKLDALEAAEQAHPKHDGGRVSVLRAITERREALAAAATP